MVKERRIELDLLRGLAIVAVILIHSIDFVSRAPSATSFEKNIYIVLDQICRFSVPVFVALSGFVLTKSNSGNLNLLTFFKKRIWRLLPAYLFCSLLIYFFLRLPTVWFQKENYSLWQIIFLGKADYPFYFVPMIVQLYLFFPAINFFLDKKKWLVLSMGLLIQISTLVFFSYQNETLKIWGPNFTDLQQYYFFGSWIFYFVLGAFLARSEGLAAKKIGILFGVLTLLGLVWTIFDCFRLLNLGEGTLIATRFTRLPVLLYCSALIIWILSKSEELLKLPNILIRLLNLLGTDSYYVYLIHTLILRILLMFGGPILGSNLILLPALIIVGSEFVIRVFFSVSNEIKLRFFNSNHT